MSQLRITEVDGWQGGCGPRRARRARARRGAPPPSCGMRLDLPAGESARFEPGADAQVALVSYAGERAVYGFNGLTNATLSERVEEHREEALARLRAAGFRDTGA